MIARAVAIRQPTIAHRPPEVLIKPAQPLIYALVAIIVIILGFCAMGIASNYFRSVLPAAGIGVLAMVVLAAILIKLQAWLYHRDQQRRLREMGYHDEQFK